MKRLILVLSFVLVSAHAYKYNDFLLKVQLDLVPKILLLDKDFNKKIKGKTVTLAIVYEPYDEDIAKMIQQFLKRKYQGRLFDYNFQIKLVEAQKFIQNPDNFTAFYILKLTQQHLAKIRDIIKKMGRYTFVYDRDDLRHGFLFSIDLQRRPVIFANKRVLKKSFDFLPQLYTLVRFVDEKRPL